MRTGLQDWVFGKCKGKGRPAAMVKLQRGSGKGKLEGDGMENVMVDVEEEGEEMRTRRAEDIDLFTAPAHDAPSARQ